MRERKIEHKERALANAPKALSRLVDNLAKAAKLKSPFVSSWFKSYCLEMIKEAMRKEGKEAMKSFGQWKAQQSIDHLHEGVQWFLFLLRDTDQLSMAHQQIIADITVRLIRTEVEEDSDFLAAIKTVINCIRKGALRQYGEPIEGLSAIRKYGKSTGINRQKGQKQDWVDGIPKALRNPVSRN